MHVRIKPASPTLMFYRMNIVENQAYVASCLCMFLSIFRILFSFFNFPELMQFTVIITVIIIFDLEPF